MDMAVYISVHPVICLAKGVSICVYDLIYACVLVCVYV